MMMLPSQLSGGIYVGGTLPGGITILGLKFLSWIQLDTSSTLGLGGRYNIVWNILFVFIFEE